MKGQETIKSPERLEIEKIINDLPWFKATRGDMRQKLLNLPENANGFLKDLIQHPVRGGGVLLINLEDIFYSPFSIYGILVSFRVQNLKNLELIYGYEYFSWKQGPESGSKGVLLIEKEGKITHVISLRGFKFAAGKEVDDTIGGFANPDETGVAGMIKRFDKEIREELGIPNIKVKQIIPLGLLQVDAGLTNNRPNLFAAVVDGEEMQLKDYEETENPDPYELRTSVIVTPIDRIGDFAREENNDAYFLACIARLILTGILPITQASNPNS